MVIFFLLLIITPLLLTIFYKMAYRRSQKRVVSYLISILLNTVLISIPFLIVIFLNNGSMIYWFHTLAHALLLNLAAVGSWLLFHSFSKNLRFLFSSLAFLVIAFFLMMTWTFGFMSNEMENNADAPAEIILDSVQAQPTATDTILPY